MTRTKEIRAIERRIAVKKDGLLAGYQLMAKVQQQLDALEHKRSALIAQAEEQT